MKKIAFILLCILNCTTSNAQTFQLIGDKCFGGSDMEVQPVLKLIDNDKILLTGRSASFPSGNNSDIPCDSSHDMWAVCFDPSLTVLWDKTLGGNKMEMGYPGIQISSNEIMFSIQSNSDSTCEKTSYPQGYPDDEPDYWIIKTDLNGNLISDMSFGSPGLEQSAKIFKFSTGEYLAAGYSSNSTGGDKTVTNFGSWDLWVVKFDSLGNKLWDQVYGGSDIELTPTTSIGFDLVESDSGQFVLAFRSNSPVSGNLSYPHMGAYDICILKIDNLGNKIWDKRYGGSGGDNICSLKKIPNGYILCGETDSPADGTISDTSFGSYDAYVIRLDTGGNQLWDKRYGGTEMDYAAHIESGPNGGFWISGITESPAGNSITETGYGESDYWIFLIDSMGNKLWDKRFGTPVDDLASNFIIMPDSSIFLCGHTQGGLSAVKTDPGYGASDFWVVHFKYGSTVGVNENSFQGDPLITLQPNPNSGLSEIKNISDKEIKFQVFNAIGQVIQSQSIPAGSTYQLDLTDESNGVYFIRAATQSGYQSLKFIKSN